MSAAALRARLSEDLKAAMQARASGEVRLLRALAAAIDNAEAVEAGNVSALPSAFGEGRNEVARRELGPAEIAALLERERDERLAAAADYARLGQEAEAERLTEEAALVERYRSS